MSTPAEQAGTVSDLGHVATPADAAKWLNQRAAEYLAGAEGQSSPDDARGLRLAASTLQAIAEVSREWRDGVAAADGLSLLARSYPEVATATASSEERYYLVACGHLADTLGQVATRLNHAVAPERARRASAGLSECAVVRGRDL
jgi:hypothetical protein